MPVPLQPLQEGKSHAMCLPMPWEEEEEEGGEGGRGGGAFSLTLPLLPLCCLYTCLHTTTPSGLPTTSPPAPHARSSTCSPARPAAASARHASLPRQSHSHSHASIAWRCVVRCMTLPFNGATALALRGLGTPVAVYTTAFRTRGIAYAAWFADEIWFARASSLEHTPSTTSRRPFTASAWRGLCAFS